MLNFKYTIYLSSEDGYYIHYVYCELVICFYLFSIDIIALEIELKYPINGNYESVSATS